MRCNNFYATGTVFRRLDPNRGHAARFAELERIVADQRAGAVQLEGNCARPKKARGTKLVRPAEHQTRGVKAIAGQFRVVSLQEKLLPCVSSDEKERDKTSLPST